MPATQGKIIPIAVLNAAVAGSALGAHEREAVEHAIAVHARRPGPLIELLHAVQDMLGHIPEAAVPRIADALNLSRAEVHGVISYYPHFRSTPAGRHVLQVCRAEACQSRGADALLAHAGQALGCGSSGHGHGHEHGTSADGAVTLEPVYCLGLCASSPAVMLDGQPHAHVSTNALDALIAQCRQPEQAGEPVAQPAHAGAEAGAGAGPGVRVYVPRDAAALAVGADAVAGALQRECAARGLQVQIVRNGSRGLLWLETLVEVETPEGRVAYGPVTADAVPGLIDAGMLQGGSHALCHGLTEAIAYLARQ